MNNEKRIAVYCCENSAYKAAETITEPDILEAVDFVPLPCSGKIDAGLVLKTLERGYGGVVVLGCPEENCTFMTGNKRARKRIDSVRAILREAGLDADAVHIDFVSSIDTHKAVTIIREMSDRVRRPVA